MNRTFTARTLARRFAAVCSFPKLVLAACLALIANSATAATVNVSNYSWLQLKPNDVTPIIGSFTGINTTAFGSTADVRWGDYVWIPTNTMTANGTEMYYAGVQLDQSRPIDKVRLQWYTAGLSVSQYFVDGSNDGAIWTTIATQTGPTPADQSANDVSVTPGSYQFVRVRFEGPDYASNASYGGPGLMLIEPFGTGTLSGDKVNWANAAFGTTITNTGFTTYNGTAYSDGTLQDRGGVTYWTGTPGNWGAGEYTTINLGTERLINSATSVWSHPYGGNDFEVQYSLDGTTFFNVANPAAAINHSPTSGIGATEINFDPTIARYIRMLNASGGSGFTLMNQMLLHSPTDGVLDSDPGINGTIEVGAFELNSSMTLTDAVTLENVGTTDTAIAIFDYSITGVDAAQFDLSSFAPTILSDGESISFDLDFTALADTQYNAVLTFETSLGDISFNISASIPEPATFALVGMGAVGMLVQVRRRPRG